MVALATLKAADSTMLLIGQSDSASFNLVETYTTVGRCQQGFRDCAAGC